MYMSTVRLDPLKRRAWTFLLLTEMVGAVVSAALLQFAFLQDPTVASSSWDASPLSLSASPNLEFALVGIAASESIRTSLQTARRRTEGPKLSLNPSFATSLDSSLNRCCGCIFDLLLTGFLQRARTFPPCSAC